MKLFVYAVALASVCFLTWVNRHQSQTIAAQQIEIQVLKGDAARAWRCQPMEPNPQQPVVLRAELR